MIHRPHFGRFRTGLLAATAVCLAASAHAQSGEPIRIGVKSVVSGEKRTCSTTFSPAFGRQAS